MKTILIPVPLVCQDRIWEEHRGHLRGNTNVPSPAFVLGPRAEFYRRSGSVHLVEGCVCVKWFNPILHSRLIGAIQKEESMQFRCCRTVASSTKGQ